MAWRRPRRRSLFRTIADALVFLLVLTMVLFAMNRFGAVDTRTAPPGRLVAIDGDTLRGPDGDIRLYGIDAPELFQTCATSTGGEYPCGREAKQALKRLTDRREIACSARDTDRFGRTVAVCLANGIDVNRQMVAEGWAIAYPGSAEYVGVEAEARQARRGLWSGVFEPPREWRRQHDRRS
ncbi:MAG: thermonuclease family protein [Hyphomicrobiales bacterium]